MEIFWQRQGLFRRRCINLRSLPRPPALSGVARVFAYGIVVPLAEPIPSDTFAFLAKQVHALGTAIKFR
jgi:hypothetical protein